MVNKRKELKNIGKEKERGSMKILCIVRNFIRAVSIKFEAIFLSKSQVSKLVGIALHKKRSSDRDVMTEI